MTRHPTPPTDVKFEMADWRRLPIECVYVGVVDGTHRWKAVSVPAGDIAAVTIEALPACTSVSLI